MTDPSYGAFVVRMLLGLVAVGLVAFVVLRVVARRWGLTARPGDLEGAMRVRDRLVLEPGRTLYLVEVSGRTLVLATGSEGTTMLTEVEGSPGGGVATDEGGEHG